MRPSGIFKFNFLCLLFFLITIAFIDKSRSEESSDCDFSSMSYDPTILKTKNGKIKGRCDELYINDPDKPHRKLSVISWMSVPFAEAPLNELRFKKPVPAKTWISMRDGTKAPSRCPQNDTFNINTSEDCLYLNIFAPASLFKQNTTNKLAIFFYIHGGKFSKGSGNDYVVGSPVFSALSNTIVVTSNYRLGPFGYFYLPNSEMSGNQGFLDQQMALKWVHDNADSFKGDKNRITICGNSAGSFFVSYHLINRLSWPYFNNAIMQSGSALYSALNYIPVEEATRRTLDVLALSECGNGSLDSVYNSTYLMECAQKVDVSNLEKNANDYYNRNFVEFNLISSELSNIYALVLDGKVINETIKQSFENGNYKKTNILTGFTSEDGGFFIDLTKFFGENPTNDVFMNMTSFEYFFKKFYKYFPHYPIKAPENIVSEVMNEYFNDHTNLESMNYFKHLIKIITEQVFLCPALYLARIYSKMNDTYLYSYSHITKNRRLPEIFGAIHADDLPYVFGEPLLNRTSLIIEPFIIPIDYEKYTDDERRLSKQIIKYWSNFVKNSNPNKFDEDDNENIKVSYWPEYKTDLPETYGQNLISNFIKIDVNQTKISNDHSRFHCEFWKKYDIYPNL